MKYLFSAAILCLVSCGQSDYLTSDSSTDQKLTHLFQQVAPFQRVSSNTTTTSGNAVSFYAASRFLEQAAWGPTPQEVAKVQAMGFSAWIDNQMALPPTLANVPDYVINYTPNDGVTDQRAYSWWPARFQSISLSGPDQLRQRLTWSIYNFIPENNGSAYTTPSYFDVLQNNVLSTYPQLMSAITLSPAMGDFLNLNQNIVGSPNENYAREVMQLFSVGLVLLNPDGSLKLDAKGNSIQTYTQNDVINSTKALSGWGNQWITSKSNGSNYGFPMIPKTGSSHDFSAKTLLGQSIPGYQSIQQDLNSFINILTTHPNTAPFIAKRLIQNMVTSTPSPQYISRVGAIFNSSNGDLKKVVKAILLDPEARAGDDPANVSAQGGKIKEPILVFNEMLRALGCVSTVYDRYTGKNNVQNAIWTVQSPLQAPNVFGYFSPDHKTPVSLYNSPEETLFTINTVTAYNNLTYQLQGNGFNNAGCQISAFTDAIEQSNDALIEMFNLRFFRGNIPPSIRGGLNTLLTNNLNNLTPVDRFGYLLGLILSSPVYGVVQ